MKKSPIERIEEHLFYSPDGCWYWTGAVNNKLRPMMTINDKLRLVSRVLYELLNNCVLDRWTFVCHTCDNPRCLNPDHLFLGTAQDNTLDMHKKGRDANFTGENHPQSRLTNAQIREIRSSNLMQKDLAKIYGMSPNHISSIINNKRWKHI